MDPTTPAPQPHIPASSPTDVAAPVPAVKPTPTVISMPTKPGALPASVASEDPDAEAERRAALMEAAVDSEIAKPINTAVPLQDLADSLFGGKKPQPVAPVPPPAVPTGPKVSPANPAAKTLDFGIRPLEMHTTPVGNLQAAAAAAVSGDKTLSDQLKKTSGAPTAASQNPNLKSIRTYESDVAEVMARTRMSSSSMIMAENRRKEAAGVPAAAAPQPAVPIGDYSKVPTAASVLAEAQLIDQSERPHTGKNLFVIVLCLLFVAGGLAGGYYFWMQSPLEPVIQANKTPTPPPPQKISGIIPADTQTVMAIDGFSAVDVITHVKAEAAKSQSAGSVKEIILSRKSATATARVNAPDMLTLMNIGAPDMLTRTLTNDWMLGVYADQNGSRNVFVIVTTNFFQNAFAGVLQWESVMPDDLKSYLISVPTAGFANTPNALTTPVTNTIRGQFQDRIIQNRDVRAFVAADGATLFLYSFVDNSHLVIAGSDAALSEIVGRLEKQTLVR